MAGIFEGLVFYMSPGPNKKEITELITNHGGTMGKHCGKDIILLVDLKNSAMLPKSQWPIFSTKLIEDSVAQKRFLNPKGYQFKLGDVAFNPKDRAAIRAPYTPEEDFIIMDYYVQNQGKNSLSFFNEMQKKGILQRTGESLKNRFKFLKAQPEEYFKTLEKTILSQKSSNQLPKVVEDAINECDEVDLSPLEVDNIAIASKMIVALQQQTGRPAEVVIHALLIFSGNLRKARDYLQSGVDTSAWTIAEDSIILEACEQDEKSDIMTDAECDVDVELRAQAVAELMRYRSTEEVDDRKKFLCVSNLLY